MASGRRWDELPAELRERLRAGRQKKRALRRLANARKPRPSRKGPKLVSVSKQQEQTVAMVTRCRRLDYALKLVRGERPQWNVTQREMIDTAVRRLYRALRAELAQVIRECPDDHPTLARDGLELLFEETDMRQWRPGQL